MPDLGAELRVRLDKVFIATFDIDVPQGGIGGVNSLFRLFQHPFSGFFGQVVYVILGHQHFDAVHELFRRPGIPGDADIFFDEMDLQTEIIQDDPVLEVAVKPVCLLHQHGPAGGSVSGLRFLFQKLDHFCETGPA
ncbi:MAG: hypothetical protein R6X11_10700 [Desulfonatronovibrio sp.]